MLRIAGGPRPLPISLRGVIVSQQESGDGRMDGSENWGDIGGIAGLQFYGICTMCAYHELESGRL
jgi:hypothetical protein